MFRVTSWYKRNLNRQFNLFEKNLFSSITVKKINEIQSLETQIFATKKALKRIGYLPNLETNSYLETSVEENHSFEIYTRGTIKGQKKEPVLKSKQ